MKLKFAFTFIISAGIGLASCTPSNSNKDASDTSSIRDTAGNTALDTAAVNDVQATGKTDTASAGYPIEESQKQGNGGARTNVGADTAGEFQQSGEKGNKK